MKPGKIIFFGKHRSRCEAVNPGGGAAALTIPIDWSIVSIMVLLKSPSADPTMVITKTGGEH